MTRFHHALAAGGTGAATDARHDPPSENREADRDDGEHGVHRLERKVASLVAPDVPDARGPDVDGPGAERPEDEGFGAGHGGDGSNRGLGWEPQVDLTGQSSQGDHVPETITEEQFRQDALGFLEANAKPRQ